MPFMLRHPGRSWEFGAQELFIVVLRVERALYIHSPHRQSLPDRDSNYDSLSLGHEFPWSFDIQSQGS